MEPAWDAEPTGTTSEHRELRTHFILPGTNSTGENRTAFTCPRQCPHQRRRHQQESSQVRRDRRDLYNYVCVLRHFIARGSPTREGKEHRCREKTFWGERSAFRMRGTFPRAGADRVAEVGGGRPARRPAAGEPQPWRTLGGLSTCCSRAPDSSAGDRRPRPGSRTQRFRAGAAQPPGPLPVMFTHGPDPPALGPPLLHPRDVATCSRTCRCRGHHTLRCECRCCPWELAGDRPRPHPDSPSGEGKGREVAHSKAGVSTRGLHTAQEGCECGPTRICKIT